MGGVLCEGRAVTKRPNGERVGYFKCNIDFSKQLQGLINIMEGGEGLVDYVQRLCGDNHQTAVVRQDFWIRLNGQSGVVNRFVQDGFQDLHETIVINL